MIILEFLTSIPDAIRLIVRHPWRSLACIIATIAVAMATVPRPTHKDQSSPQEDRRIVRAMKWLWEREE